MFGFFLGEEHYWRDEQNVSDFIELISNGDRWINKQLYTFGLRHCMINVNNEKSSKNRLVRRNKGITLDK